MSSVAALDRLLDSRHVWRGQAISSSSATQSTGHPELDATLPGVGELRLLWPTRAPCWG